MAEESPEEEKYARVGVGEIGGRWVTEAEEWAGARVDGRGE